MDGLPRLRATIPLLFVVATCGLGGLAYADDPQKELPRDSPLYVSPKLDREFLGAVSLDLRIEPSADAPRRNAELGLLMKNRARSPKFKSKILSISLEQVATGNGSHSEGTPSPVPLTYLVSGLPEEFIKAGETLQIRLSSEDGQENTARLMLCGSDGKPCRDVKLILAKLPKEPTRLETEK